MINSYSKNTFFIGDFDEELTDLILPLTDEIKNQSKYKEGLLNLYVNSYGGYAHLLWHMVELVEDAKRAGVIVRTIVPSAAYSAGSMLAITGSPGERYIGHNAEHLVHMGAIGSIESTTKQLERNAQWKARHFKKVMAHYTKYAEVPNLREELEDDGFFVPANKAIHFKLADKYMTKLK